MVDPTTPHILFRMAQTIQEWVRLGLNQVASDYSQAALEQKAHNTLEWLCTQKVRDWYEGQSHHSKIRFVALLVWIAEETRRISQADGYFITLNYVVSQSFSGSLDAPLSSFDHTILLQKHWTPLIVDGFMVRCCLPLRFGFIHRPQKWKGPVLETHYADSANRTNSMILKQADETTLCPFPSLQQPTAPSL